MFTSEKQCHILFLGSCVPEHVNRHDAAFSAAGNIFQENLLQSLAGADCLQLVDVLSLAPLTSFPRGSHIIWPGLRYVAACGARVVCPPFLNIGFLKVITALPFFGIHLLRWLVSRPRRVDAILMYNLNIQFALPAVLLGRIFGVPVIPIVADIIVPGSFGHNTILRRFESRLQKWILRHAAGLIVLSRSIAEDFAPQKTCLLMEGAVPEDLLNMEPAPVDLKSSLQKKKSLLFSGGLGEQSGICLLMDAFQRLKDFDGELWICGRGPMEQQIKRKAEMDMRIRFLGYVERSELLRFQREATVLINPRPESPESRYSFPSKLLEYMASGRPVISTVWPNLADEYGAYVYLLEEETPDNLASLIGKVLSLSEQELSAKGAKARAFVLENKTWKKQAGRITEFIRQTIESAGA